MFALVTSIIPITLLCVFTLMNTAAEIHTKIINGFDSDIKEAPYMASLRHLPLEIKKQGSGHFCGGTIVKSHIIITAAHCISGKKQEAVTVVVGCTFLSLDFPAIQKLRIAAWQMHEDFRLRARNDIGIVFTVEYIKPVLGAVAYLPLNLRNLKPGTSCLASGWGKTDRGSTSNRLQGIWENVLSQAECKKYTRARFMCAGTFSNNGSSHADSGGPLRCNNTLGGVIVGGKPDGPTVFAEIRAYVKWIRKTQKVLYKNWKNKKGRNGIKSLNSGISNYSYLCIFALNILL